MSRILPNKVSGPSVVIGEELLIYSKGNESAHCLQPLARHVYEMCDGRTTLAEARLRLHELGHSVDESLVSATLDELEESGLIKSEELFDRNLSRRDLLSATTKVAAAGLVCSVGLPSPASAQSVAALNIVSAFYSTFTTAPTTASLCGSGAVAGGADVTATVQSAVVGNTLTITADNTTFGDTNSGHVKELRIDYECSGVSQPLDRTCENGVANIVCP